MQVKVAVYIRVSTASQVEGTSLERQEELCIQKAKEIGFVQEQILIYKEEGFSGEDIDRPEMNRLRNDIKQGDISTIVMTHPDRLSRDLTDKLIVCKEFDREEISLVFVDTEYKNTPEGQLFFNLQSSIAQYELAMIRKRTLSGKLKAVEKHQKVMPMRVAPYGYDLVNSALVINEEEATFVRMIYDWYVNKNMTYREIGEALFSLGATPKRKESKNWNQSSISRILTAETYIGKYPYNRKKTNKVIGEKTATGKAKRTYSVRDKDQWLYVNVPPIVDKSLFEAAQKQKDKNLKRSGNTKNEYLLRSMLKCGHCGTTMYVVSYTSKPNKKGIAKNYSTYRCPNRYPRKYGEGIEKCSFDKPIKTVDLDEYIWRLVTEVISDPTLFEDKMSNKSSEFIDELKRILSLKEKQLEKKEKEKEKVKTMFKRDVITEDEMIEDMKKINKDIDTIRQDIDGILFKLDDTRKNETDTERMKQKIEDIRRSLRDNQIGFAEKRFIVETLIDEIVVKVQESGEIGITCLGALDEAISERMSTETGI